MTKDQPNRKDRRLLARVDREAERAERTRTQKAAGYTARMCTKTPGCKWPGGHKGICVKDFPTPAQAAEQFRGLQERIVPCWPVSFDDLTPRDREILRQARADLKGAPPVYYPGSVITRCMDCGIDVYLAPRGREFAAEDPGARVLCWICAAIAIGHDSYGMINFGNPDSVPRMDL